MRALFPSLVALLADAMHENVSSMREAMLMEDAQLDKEPLVADDALLVEDAEAEAAPRGAHRKAMSQSNIQSKPHILYVLIDDWGWSDVGYHWPNGTASSGVTTPKIDALVKEGIELDRHYTFKVCSPTRSAIQSGRNPLNVNALNIDHDYWNEADPVSGFSGIPRNMTGIAQKLADAGYQTHFYGKWDAGMATPDHTPHGRGYQQAISFWGHGNGYWSLESGRLCEDQKVKDLWATTGPPHQSDLNPPSCAQENQTKCIYEEYLFRDRVISAIEQRTAAKPLFIFWSLHLVHDPYELPDEHLAKWSHIDSEVHRFYYGMVSFMDEEVGLVMDKLKSEGIWHNTLVILHSDNGGDFTRDGESLNTDHGANNYPLRGGKNTNWEGGIRVNALVSGGYLPNKVRGTKQRGLVSAWDWYATLAHVAGVDATDFAAEKAGLPPIDSINQWPFLLGETAHHPRTTLRIGDSRGNEAWVGGFIGGHYKILVGRQGQSVWTDKNGPSFYDRVTAKKTFEFCGLKPETGCLYDIMEDPSETNNIAESHPEVFGMLLEQVARFNKTVFNPDRGQSHPRACTQAVNAHNGFWGPFVP